MPGIDRDDDNHDRPLFQTQYEITLLTRLIHKFDVPHHSEGRS